MKLTRLRTFVFLRPTKVTLSVRLGILGLLALWLPSSAQEPLALTRLSDSLGTDLDPASAAWELVPIHRLERWPFTKSTYSIHSANLSAHFQALWDLQHLHLLVSRRDDLRVVDSRLSQHATEDDSVEILINPHAATGTNDQHRPGPNVSSLPPHFLHLVFPVPGNDPPSSLETPEALSPGGLPDGFFYTWSESGDTDALYLRLPWASLGLSAVTAGLSFTFDIQVNDDDDGGSREAKLTWADPYGEAWFDPSLLGWIRLEDPASIGRFPVGNVQTSGSSSDDFSFKILVHHDQWPDFLTTSNAWLTQPESGAGVDDVVDEVVQDNDSPDGSWTGGQTPVWLALQSPWMGWFYVVDFSPWIYHAEHAWLYLYKVSEESLYFYEPGRGWFWTGRSLYPYVYAFEPAPGSWLYYLQGTGFSGKRWFFQTGADSSWFSVGP